VFIVVFISLSAQSGNFCICSRNLAGKPEKKRPFGRRRHSWEDNIKMNLEEIGWEGVDWIRMVQDRDQWRTVVNTVMNLRVP
jgi:hypothetical protein